MTDATGAELRSTLRGATGVFGVGGRLGKPRKLWLDQKGATVVRRLGVLRIGDVKAWKSLRLGTFCRARGERRFGVTGDFR